MDGLKSAPLPEAEKPDLSKSKEKIKKDKALDTKKDGDELATDLVVSKPKLLTPEQLAKKYEAPLLRDGFAIAHEGDNDFVINKKGETISKEYFKITAFQEGRAWAQKPNKMFTMLDVNGQEIDAKHEYTDAHHFGEGKTGVQENGKWHFIDAKGKDLKLGNFDEVYDFREARAGVRKGSKWYFIKEDGTALNNKKYDEVEDFYKGHAFVRQGEDYTAIDRNGKQIDISTLNEIDD